MRAYRSVVDIISCLGIASMIFACTQENGPSEAERQLELCLQDKNVLQAKLDNECSCVPKPGGAQRPMSDADNSQTETEWKSQQPNPISE